MKASLFIILAQGVVALAQMYCEPDDCYTLLGLDRYDSPSKEDIKKAYRQLSRQLHPDRNRGDPNASEKFAKVARAYEVLVDDESREEYHYARDHPEDVLGNQYRYYTRVYAPKADPRIVIVSSLLGLSILQYLLQILMHKNGKYYLRHYNPKFQQEVKKIARERLEVEKKDGTVPLTAPTAKRRKQQQKKSANEDLARLAQLEKEVGDELIETVQVEGGYSMPTLQDLLVIKVLKLPYSLPKWILFNFRWFYRRSVLKLPLNCDEKTLLLTSELSLSEAALRDEYGDDGFEKLLDTECWKRDNFLKFQEDLFKEKYPQRYKQYMRWKKNEK